MVRVPGPSEQNLDLGGTVSCEVQTTTSAEGASSPGGEDRLYKDACQPCTSCTFHM